RRAEFEQRARDDGLRGFAITERDAAGELRVAGPRASYVPVLYTEPVAANRAAFGFDVTSNPARRDALDRAARSGQLAATRRIDLVQDGGVSRPGVLLVAPVFARGGGALRG